MLTGLGPDGDRVRRDVGHVLGLGWVSVGTRDTGRAVEGTGWQVA